MSNLVKKVQNAVFQGDLFKLGAKIVLGVSGGPDSVAMLDIFSRLEIKYDLELIIAHVNYGHRGVDSKKDEEFVRGLAEKYGYNVFVLHPAKTQGEKSLKSEDMFRKVRYEYFERVRALNDFDFICVAHSADDQVETFLLRLLRGSGMQGLTGMKPKNGRIIRPLLSISRSEIMEYLGEKKISWRLDKTNLELKFLRNRVRNKLILSLEKDFNPNIKKTLLSSVQTLNDDYDYILTETQKTSQEFLENFRVSKFLKLHLSLQRRVLRAIIEQKKKDLKDIDASHIKEILKMAKSTKNKAQTVILKGLKITRRGDKLFISKLN